MIQLYDRHSITAQGVDETVNWNMKDPLFSSLLLALFLVVTAGATLSEAQIPGFTNSSVSGMYALTIESKFEREIGIGVCTADGLPTGLATMNCPQITITGVHLGGAIQVPFNGRYMMNANGNGTGTMQVTVGNAPINNVNLNLLVTQSSTPTGNTSRNALVILGVQQEIACNIDDTTCQNAPPPPPQRQPNAVVIYKFEKLN